MTGRVDPGRSEQRDTLLLYCPYDRRVTRHARRGQDQEVICLECGRPVDSVQSEAGDSQPEVYAQRTARFTPVVEPPAARRSQARQRPRRARGPGVVPFVIVAIALGVGVFAAVNVAGRLAEPGDSPIVTAARPAATTGGSQSQQSPPAGQTTPGNQATAGAAAPGQNQFVRIANTGGEGAFLRRTTNLDDRLRAWADNTRLRVLGPDTSVNGTLWRQVEDPVGNQGWIPAQYTQPES